MIVKKTKRYTKIISVIIAFAMISLATIGFATWGISIESPLDDISIGINVEGTYNKTFILEGSVAETYQDEDGNKHQFDGIKLAAEDTNVDDVGGSSVSSSKSQLQVPLNASMFVSTNPSEGDNLDYSLGDSVPPDIQNYLKDNIDSIDASIKIEATSNQINSLNKQFDKDIQKAANYNTSGDLNSFTYHPVGYKASIFGRDETTTYKYLDIDSTLTNKDVLNNMKFSVYLKTYVRIDISLETTTLKWGNFFKGKDPATFYNEKIEELRLIYQNASAGIEKETARENYLLAAEYAANELREMKAALDGKQLTISLTANYNSTLFDNMPTVA